MTLLERIELAKAAMNAVHAAFIQAEQAVRDFADLDTPENTSDLNQKTVNALRRELARLKKITDRAIEQVDDVHNAMNAIVLDDDVIAPQYGK